MSTKVGKKYLDKNGLSYFRQKLKEEFKNEQLWEQGENIDGTEGGVQIAYYGNAVGEASVSEGVAYNYKKSDDEILPISIKSLSSEEKSTITSYIGDNNYNYVFNLDFSSIDDPIFLNIIDLCNRTFNLSVCEYVENIENTSISELSNVKSIMNISENADIIGIFTDYSEFSQLEISDNENLSWGLLEIDDDISVNKNSTYIIGVSTGAFGIASHAEGYYTTANGDYSHSEGNSTHAKGKATHTEGSGSIGLGVASHAEGINTKAEGTASHAEGSNTYAEGDFSHTEGSNTHAQGVNSHTEGSNTITTNFAEHAEGVYNKSNTGIKLENQTISSIGIGLSVTDRKNAVEVMQNGDMYVHGLGDYDGTNAVVPNSDGKTAQSLQDYISNIELTPGPGLEYHWDGTQLGVKREDEDEDDFEYSDLIGPTGEGLDFYCDGTWIGIKKESDDSYEEYYIKGDQGDSGIGFGYLGCTWDQYEMIMNRMYLDKYGNLQTTSNEDSEIPDNCIKVLDKFPGLSAEHFSYWLDNIYNWLNHTSNTYVFEKYINYLKETEPDIYSDLYGYIEDIAYSCILLFVQTNINNGLFILILPIFPWGDYPTISSSLNNIGFGGNIHSYRGGNSILFYEDKITTDTNNKADVPTSFSVRVGDLVIDENFNLYKCIEE